LDQDIIELFRKYIDKQCSAAELEKVLVILQVGTYPDELDYALTQDANKVIEAGEDIGKWNHVSTLNVHHKLITAITDQKKTVNPKRPGVILKMVSISAAACILVFFGWYLYDLNIAGIDRIQYEGDIAPGKAGATLRLQNGKEISLNGLKTGVVIKDNQLRYNDGSGVGVDAKASVKEMYTANTAPGNTYMVTLPDGTQVWLNAASQLDFPSHFEGKNRMVSLKGEAYFQVAKDKLHPFIVESRGMQVKVLGTHFNINSYADEKITKTTLIEGSVQLITSSLRGLSTEAILKPGQQGTLADNGTLAVSEVDTTLAMAWKNNKFIFENNDIESVMRMVQRWYNVEVIYSGPLPDAAFGGKVSRFSNVSNVLRVLEATGGAHFKIDGRKIYVSK
jgi:transmembrane sensor